MSNSLHPQKSPVLLLLTIILLSMGTFLLAPSLLMLLGAKTLGLSLPEFFSAILNDAPTPQLQYTLLLIQALSGTLSFIVVPIWFIKKYENEVLSSYFHDHHIRLQPILIVLGIILSMMVCNSLIIEWNLNLQFPESISNIIDPMEVQNKKMTEFIIDFHSVGYFLCTLIVVALIPAIGEELLFRGLIQKYFTQIWRNPHIAIWASAAFFSAFHLQFYGFFPRLILGAGFGYLFYFSGNLSYAIIGHFINNGFTLLMMYLFQQDIIGYDIEELETITGTTWLLFLIITALLFVLFKKQFHITPNLKNE